jgi:hypothetical protein
MKPIQTSMDCQGGGAINESSCLFLTAHEDFRGAGEAWKHLRRQQVSKLTSKVTSWPYAGLPSHPRVRINGHVEVLPRWGSERMGRDEWSIGNRGCIDHHIS